MLKLTAVLPAGTVKVLKTGEQFEVTLAVITVLCPAVAISGANHAIPATMPESATPKRNNLDIFMVILHLLIHSNSQKMILQ